MTSPDKARAALEFYARHDTYHNYCAGAETSRAERDCGELARAALAALDADPWVDKDPERQGRYWVRCDDSDCDQCRTVGPEMVFLFPDKDGHMMVDGEGHDDVPLLKWDRVVPGKRLWCPVAPPPEHKEE